MGVSGFDPGCLVQCPNFGNLPKQIREEQVVFWGAGPRVSKMSFALEQPQGFTVASLGLLLRKRHFQDSRAVTPDYLA